MPAGDTITNLMASVAAKLPAPAPAPAFVPALRDRPDCASSSYGSSCGTGIVATRLNTCDYCGHYTWAHGKHCCGAIVNNDSGILEAGPRLACGCFGTYDPATGVFRTHQENYTP